MKKSVLAKVPLKRMLDNTPQYFWIRENIEVMAFRQQGEIFVYSSICPHMGGQLQLESGSQRLKCPWHPLTVDIRSSCTNHSRFSKINRFAAEEQNNSLIIYES